MSIKLLRYTSILTVILLCSSFYHSNAQNRWEVGGGLGATNYTGDLAPTFDFGNTRFGGTFYGRYYLNKYTNLRNTFGINWIHGDESGIDDPISQIRQASFDNLSIDLSSAIEYHFLPFRTTRKKRDMTTPYAFLGLGFSYVWPLNQSSATGDVPFEGNAFVPYIPLGFGVKRKLNTHWDFGVEIMTHLIMSDRSDGINGSSTPDTPLLNFQSNRNDKNMYLGFYFSYHFYEVICPSPTLKVF
ncbi:type IX secretion system protein PorG [Sediminitomix flava]|uniref:Outer membrane protein with beta-barrel domain n=1 Tax=Sediminitomix flava TaxID=379075 RepID=A0A315ZB57_SEDFL|nr:DUF6089 family protein [Sediminitomix flava]PWJ42522.1 outer membrane protein with beta-barrel domain [Sediminitomix flava]